MEVLWWANGGKEMGEQGEAAVLRDMWGSIYKHSDYFCDHTLYCGGCGFCAWSS